MKAFLILLCSCFLFGFYLIRKVTQKESIEQPFKDEPKEHIKPIGLTFQLEFNEQKDGSKIAFKCINTARFGLVKIKVYKGVQYSDNDLNLIELTHGKNVIHLDEMTDNDIITIFTLIKKL